MIINAQTKISALIKANPECIDVIASINPHFKKLKNPILRRVLAKRVSIEDAARIGNTTIQVFFDKLQSIGFTIEENNPVNLQASKNKNMSDFYKTDKLIKLDVRPDIQSGQDPFQRIMRAIKALNEDEVLQVINIFEPIPLISLLQSKGYATFVERPEKGLVYTYFKKDGDPNTQEQKELNSEVETPDFDSKMESFCRRLVTIDVRELPMPEPMVKILSELESLPEYHGLYVHHKKFPQFLIPELEKRGFALLSKEIDENQVELVIWKV
jgi:uncharacterized protein (DUF2249 family)